MKFDIGAMSVGDILDRGLKILFARLPTFFAIYLIILTPSLLLQLFLGAVQAELFGPPTPELLIVLGLGSLVVLVLAFILGPIGTAAILHIIGQEFVNERVGVGQSLRFALGRFGRLLGTALLAGLIIMLGSCLIVPGILFWVWYAFCEQVVVMENLAGMDALNRSKELGKGFYLRVFGVLVLLMVISLIAAFLPAPLELVIPAYERVQTEFGLQQRLVSYPNYVIQIAVSTLIGILASCYHSICITLFYFDLRIRKEGFDLELAARQQQPPGEEQKTP
jgi:hypothetical protein